MEFPITVQRLQHIGDEYCTAKKKEIVNKFVEKFTKDIIEMAWKSRSIEDSPKNKRRYVVHGKDLDMSHCPVYFEKSDCVTEIVAEMKRRFPDMVIIEDPLATYILFDWN